MALNRACVVGVWHCGVDADNPALGTTGVQTLLDALPAATMKVVRFDSTYGHITTPVSTHARLRDMYIGMSRMALVVTCMSHGLANRVRWFGCACTPSARHVAGCGIQGRLPFGASSWSALEEWHCFGAFQ